MKRPLFLLALMILAAVATHWWLERRPQHKPAAPSRVVPIKDRATIDFSSGQPVVIDDVAQKELIDAAMKEIQEAAKNIKFAPLAPSMPEVPPSATENPPQP